MRTTQRSRFAEWIVSRPEATPGADDLAEQVQVSAAVRGVWCSPVTSDHVLNVLQRVCKQGKRKGMTFVHMSSWTVASLPVSLHDCDIVSARSPGVFPGPRAESVLEHSGCVLVRAGKVPIRPARERRTKWERSSSVTTSRSTGSSRTRPVTKASESGGGSA